MPGMSGIFTGMDVSGSGLSAQRFRMEVISHNLAYAEIDSTCADGRPYRRRQVAFHAVLADGMSDGAMPYRGVRATARADYTPGAKVRAPAGIPEGHPGIDADGNVEKSNVDVHSEMVNLLQASRCYEANIAAVRSFREMVQRALSIGR
jgi:flagellar basal-body rod protein FlgC